MKVTIIPNKAFTPGHARQVLSNFHHGAIVDHEDGTLTADLTEQEIDLFRLRSPGDGIRVAGTPAALYGASDEAWQAATGCQTPEEFRKKKAAVQFRGPQVAPPSGSQGGEAKGGSEGGEAKGETKPLVPPTGLPDAKPQGEPKK